MTKMLRLKEVLVDENAEIVDPLAMDSQWKPLFGVMDYYSIEGFCNDIVSDAHCETLFREYIAPDLWEGVISYCDEDSIEDERISMYRQIIAWLRRTRRKHIAVINSMENLDLMKGIESSVKNTYIDAPQNPNPDLDNHATTFTKSVSSNDATTPIERVNEIRSKIEDEYTLWMKEFYESFIIPL